MQPFDPRDCRGWLAARTPHRLPVRKGVCACMCGGRDVFDTPRVCVYACVWRATQDNVPKALTVEDREVPELMAVVCNFLQEMVQVCMCAFDTHTRGTHTQTRGSFCTSRMQRRAGRGLVWDVRGLLYELAAAPPYPGSLHQQPAGPGRHQLPGHL